MARGTPRAGLAAEFGDPPAMLAAVRRLREQGFAQLDTFAPYEVAGGDDALGLPRPKLLRWMLGPGLAAGAAAYALQWFLNGWQYPLIVGGRPLNSAPAWLPIAVVTTLMMAALAAAAIFAWCARLPALWHPLFEIEGFERATSDRFWVAVSRRDPLFDSAGTAALLEAAGALRIVSFGKRG